MTINAAFKYPTSHSPNWLSVAVGKHWPDSILEKKSITWLLGHSPSSRKIKTETQGRNLKSRTDAA